MKSTNHGIGRFSLGMKDTRWLSITLPNLWGGIHVTLIIQYSVHAANGYFAFCFNLLSHCYNCYGVVGLSVRMCISMKCIYLDVL